LRLSRNPGLLRAECLALPNGAWIVIDEVQRVPDLLDEVQHLMVKMPRFVLSSSSARKLERSGVNLLAGRAEVRHLFPLVTAETGTDRPLDAILAEGMLPLAVTGKRPKAFLRACSEVYLKQEVHAEALVREIGPFHRFLEIAGRSNGQAINVAGIARDAGIAPQTAGDFFQILVDTLLGGWLSSWKPKRAVKQVAHPKFFLFDTGVARQLAGTTHLQLHPEERGALLETFLLHELRAHLHYADLDLPDRLLAGPRRQRGRLRGRDRIRPGRDRGEGWQPLGSALRRRHPRAARAVAWCVHRVGRLHGAARPGPRRGARAAVAGVPR